MIMEPPSQLSGAEPTPGDPPEIPMHRSFWLQQTLASTADDQARLGYL
jgi:hypothetical protein